MRLVRVLIAAVVILLAVLLINLLRLPAATPAGEPLPLAADAAASARLAAALRIPSISHADPAQEDAAAFENLIVYLAANFPRTQAALAPERIGQGLLYTWRGRSEAAPALLLAHLDVVPVEPGTESIWTHPPFSGAVDGGYIWGRGALDDKASALAQLEAVEQLLAAGFTPAQTVYLAFGLDEEVGGSRGAALMAQTLQARGVRAAFTLDEGGAITEGLVAGVTRPVASVMAAEKGYVSFRLSARGVGGHSSMPPPQTAAGQLARAVARVQDAPLPARLAPPVTDMLLRLAPEMGAVQRLAIANRWLFEPLLLRSLAAAPVTNAMIRSTTAPTVLRAGIKDNILPAEAQAVINFRLLPGDTVEDVQAHLRRVIDDEGIELAIEGGFGDPASPVSATDTAAFRLIERSINTVYPEALVSTGLVLGATDARHYAAVHELRYNFAPLRLGPDDLARIHGANERIAEADYARMIAFYRALISGLE